MGNAASTDIGRIGIWTGMLDALPAAQAREAAQEIESLGYGALWIPEAVGRDPLVFATHLLDATERLALATGIANIWARDPMTMANADRTIEEAHPGRFLLGLGVSHQHLVQFVRKHDYERPLSRMRDYLSFMKNKGRYFAAGPQELPDNIVLAALGPKMLELAATETAGAHPYFVPPEHTVIARDTMGPDPLLAVEQMAVLDTDAESARATARQAMSIYVDLPNYQNNLRRLGFGDDDFAEPYSDRLVDAIVVWGDESAVADRVQAHVDAGADHVCVQPLGSGPDVAADGWRRLAPALL